MSFLDEILARKRVEVERVVPDPRPGGPRRSLYAALAAAGGPVRAIAEVKRASPSVGTIASNLDAVAVAREYEAGGAAAISVLTDGPAFGGSLEDLRAVRAAVSVPVLRKDFLIDRRQLREVAADAVLLIVAALAPARLAELIAEARELEMDALVEVHSEPELGLALEAGARIVGINNRDLRTFHVDLAVSERLAPIIPPKVRVVAESGVRSAADVRRLRRAGLANFLIGEALVRSPDPAAFLRELA